MAVTTRMASELTLTDKSGRVDKLDVPLNSIVERDGVRIYQSISYGDLFVVDFTGPDGVTHSAPLPLYQPNDLEDTSYRDFSFSWLPYQLSSHYRADVDKRSMESPNRLLALRLTEGVPFSRLGIDIALGPRADARMTAWEEMYVPMRLRDRLRGIMVPGPEGTPVKLVESERVLFTAARDPEAPSPTPFPGLYVAIALGSLVPLALLGGFAFVSALRGRWTAAQRIARIAIAVIAALWYLATGLAGTAVVLMETLSKHVFWYGNWNVALLCPLALVAAWMVPRALVTGRGARAARWVGSLCGLSALVALVVSISGVSGQSSGAVTMAFAPTTMYLALLVLALTLIRAESP